MTGPGEQGGEPLEHDVGEPITWDHEMPVYEMTSEDVDAFAAEHGE